MQNASRYGGEAFLCGPRTAEEFREETKRIQQRLSCIDKEVSDIFHGIRDVWKGDFERYRESEDEWQEHYSPEPGEAAI